MTAPVYAPLSQPPPPSPLADAAADFVRALNVLVAAAQTARPASHGAVASKAQEIHDAACVVVHLGGGL